MNKVNLITLAIVLLLPLCLIAQSNEADWILSVCNNSENTGKMEIFRTTDDNYAGSIVWLNAPNDAGNKPLVDHGDPDAKLYGSIGASQTGRTDTSTRTQI